MLVIKKDIRDKKLKILRVTHPLKHILFFMNERITDISNVM